MTTPITRILRSATRKLDDTLNILCSPTHERTEVYIAKTGHQFWALQGPGLKTWDDRFAPVPANYTILPGMEVPPDVPIDLVLSQTRYHQFDVGKAYARRYNCPLVTLEHVLPRGQGEAGGVKDRRGDLNVFISDYSREAWGFSGDDTVVIEHGVDTHWFWPDPTIVKQPRCLAVVNQWKTRPECGYDFWVEATEGLPTMVVGDNPGLSEPARSLADLAFAYQSSLVFVNTASASPIPSVLLEAMSCGCVAVSRRNPMVETVIKPGFNGYLSDTPAEMRAILAGLLAHPDPAIRMGENARNTILGRFSLERFVADWQTLFERADRL